MTNPRIPADVQADIDHLTAEIDKIGDAIFAREQAATDYRKILREPNAGTENLAALAMLREHKRAHEIAIASAKEDLKSAEAHQHKLQLTAKRLQLKATLAERLQVARGIDDALAALAKALIQVRKLGTGAMASSSLSAFQHHLGDAGYVVLSGTETMADSTWAVRMARGALDRHLELAAAGAAGTTEFSRHVEGAGQEMLRHWDLVNSSRKLQIIDHDPAQTSDPNVAVTIGPLVDPDPTEDDLAAIAGMEPDKQARALKAFANSEWAARTGGMLQSASTAS